MKLTKTKSTEQRIEEAVLESHDAISAFQSVIERLRQANLKIIEARAEDLERIDELKENVNRATEMEEKNNAKIVKFLNIIGE